MDTQATDPIKLGRPTLYDKRLKRTFMLSGIADEILDRIGQQRRLSRSDVLECAVRAFEVLDRLPPQKLGKT